MEKQKLEQQITLEIEELEERIAPGVVITTGLSSPQGTNTVVGPDAATGGLVTGFTAVTTQGPGDIANLDVSFVC